MEDKKVYSVVGTVTIGTDEYRNLIEERLTAQQHEHDYIAKYRNEQCKTQALNKEIEALREELAKYKKFIKKNSMTINEDISVFMSMSGDDE